MLERFAVTPNNNIQSFVQHLCTTHTAAVSDRRKANWVSCNVYLIRGILPLKNFLQILDFQTNQSKKYKVHQCNNFHLPLEPFTIHILMYITTTADVKSLLLHLIRGFLIEVELPPGDTKSNNVEAGSNEAVEGIVLETLVDISDKDLPAFIMVLQRQVLKKGCSLAIEEEAHHQQLHQPPCTNQQQA